MAKDQQVFVFFSHRVSPRPATFFLFFAAVQFNATGSDVSSGSLTGKRVNQLISLEGVGRAGEVHLCCFLPPGGSFHIS